MFRIPGDKIPERLAAQRRIAVVPACRGCGASFAAGIIARQISNEAGCDDGPCVTLAELGLPHFYRALGLDQRFSQGGFEFYEDALEKRKSFFAVRNECMGLRLFLRRPGAEGTVPPMCVCKMPGEHVVFDLSGADDEWLEEVLPETDTVVLVADPMPTKLLAGAERIERIRLSCPDVRVLVNRMNKGVPRRDLIRFLGTQDITELPDVCRLICSAEYSCVLPADIPELSSQLPKVPL